jgi:hypothetical protein
MPAMLPHTLAEMLTQRISGRSLAVFDYLVG